MATKGAHPSVAHHRSDGMPNIESEVRAPIMALTRLVEALKMCNLPELVAQNAWLDGQIAAPKAL